MTTHSTFIHQFQSLCEEILQKIKEAVSNIEFLQVIKQPCAVLECVIDPDEISQHIPQIINLFRFIWKESEYYNSEARITNLFKALSNQIIILCRTYIKLDDLFHGGETKKALGEFSKCIGMWSQPLFNNVGSIVFILKYLYKYLVRTTSRRIFLATLLR